MLPLRKGRLQGTREMIAADLRNTKQLIYYTWHRAANYYRSHRSNIDRSNPSKAGVGKHDLIQ